MFERALTQVGTLQMLAATVDDLGAVRIAAQLRDEFGELDGGDVDQGELSDHLKPLRISNLKRLFYVGVTRSKRHLMYITNNSNPHNGLSPFLRVGTGLGICR